MQKEKIRIYFLLAILLATLVLVIYVFQPFLITLALAIVCAVVLHPLYKIILRIVRMQSLAAFLTIIFTAVCIIIPLSLIGLQVASEAQDLYGSLVLGNGQFYLDRAINAVEHTLSKIFPRFEGISGELSSNIDTYMKGMLTWVIERTGTIFSSVAVLGLKFFLFFISLYYLLRDGQKLRKGIIEISPLADIDDESVFARLKLAVNSVIKGNITVALIQGIIATGGLIIFGVPNAVLWGSAAAIAALIPGLGTAIIIVPAVIFLVITSTPTAAIGLAIWGALAVGMVDNLIGPKLIGHNIRLHPLLILFSVLGGLSFFGPIGIFLGPLSVSLFFALLEIYSKPIVTSS